MFDTLALDQQQLLHDLADRLINGEVTRNGNGYMFRIVKDTKALLKYETAEGFDGAVVGVSGVEGMPYSVIPIVAPLTSRRNVENALLEAFMDLSKKLDGSMQRRADGVN